MLVDAELSVHLPTAAERAARLEALGIDGAFTFEGQHDPFLPLLLAARHTERLEVMTAIAVAFARTPMTIATIGDDLNRASRGRAIIGLGTQIRPHIERRFSMPWSDPAARMREFVGAVRAIWRSWHEGAPLRFEGRYYQHTLMTPFFDPGPSEWGPARLWLAGVGPRMTEVAGEVGDGFIVHPFSTPDFFRATTLPALARGFARRADTAGADRPAGFQISWPVITITGANDAELAAAEAMVRQQLAFYGSTPAYRVVLDHHGWGELQPELNALSKQGRWHEMVALVSDDIVDAIAVRAPYSELGAALRARFDGLVDRLAINTAYLTDREPMYAAALPALRAP